MSDKTPSEQIEDLYTGTQNLINEYMGKYIDLDSDENMVSFF